jgi:hypothetical protein
VKQWEPQAAAAVVGLAAFELWKAWGDNAPSLSELRKAAPGDIGTAQRLSDANITVGSLALIIGVAFLILTRDFTVLLLLLAIFAALSWFHGSTLNSDPR